MTEVLGSPERPVNPRMRAQREVVLSPVKWPGERTEQDVSPTPMNSQNVSGSPVWGGNTDSNENTNGSPGWGSNKSASGNADIDENANDLPSWGEDQQQGSQQGSPQNQAWKNSPQKDNQQETWGSSLQKDQIQESPGLGQQWASSPKQDQAQTWGSPQKYGSAQQSPINKNTRNQNKQKGKASGDKWGVEKKKKNVKNSREVKFVIHQPIKDAGQSSTGGGGWNTNGASNPSSPSGWNDNGATNTNSPSADAAGWNSDGATNPTSSQATQASAGATSGWNSGGASNPTSPDQPTPPARKTFSDAWGSPEGGGFAASVRTVSNDGDNEVAPTNNSTVEGETPAWNVGGAGSPGGGTGWD